MEGPAVTDDAFDFAGRCVVITGAGRGLGRAMALGFARRGADVVVSSRKAEACAEVVAEIVALGARAVAVPCHVGDWDALPGLIDGALSAFGRIDTLINNAGIAPTAPGSRPSGSPRSSRPPTRSAVASVWVARRFPILPR